MAGTPPDLLACYWTLAGPVRPGDASEVSPRPFEERVAAAAEAGYTGIGFSNQDLAALRDSIGFAGVRRILDAYGIRQCQYEMLFDWWGDGEQRAASDEMRGLLLSALEEIAIPDSHLKAGPDLTGRAWPAEVYAEAFAQLAEETRRAGGRAGLEFIPFADLRDPRTTMAVIDAAAHDAGGIVIDIWHVARGGTPCDDVRRIPAEKIVFVELDDADAEPIGELVEDTVDRRRHPGDGDLDVRGFVEAVRSTGYDGAYGVEVLSEQQRALSLHDASRMTYEKTIAQFR